ncbi:MAG: ABC transporter substrate-binding protein [Gammaproteobacteria bacterium]|nr:ABC transporter substrate-binding protein [Gammaproteobacteria bacterium]
MQASHTQQNPDIRISLAAICCIFLLLAGCDGQPWNRPYPADDAGRNIYYASFSERPNHLDPAQSYSSNEVTFTGQIYEPPLQYHYLKRPYQLIPLTATTVPVAHYLDADGQPLPDDAENKLIAFSYYDIQIQTGIHYQPHPAFARDEQGDLLYAALGEAELEDIHTLGDFSVTGTRELVAADYVYQIKRLAHPKLHSPIFGLMSDYIVGLGEYADTLEAAYEKEADGREGGVYLDLAHYPLAGAEVLDRYRYRVTIEGKYPQLLYWLAMPFFAPVAPEVDAFYSQPGMQERNITLDWYPVGTGPYMLTVNNPNRQMVMERNPNFHGEHYPDAGEPGDREAGLLDDAGKPMPFIERIVFSLEKEDIPYWNKFLQGYYDSSGISSDSFDQAVNIGAGGEVNLTEGMQSQGIRLNTAVATSIYYTGFNMQDPVVGGDSERARKLRLAISIAIDFEEYISIFLNGRGIAAQGMIPPGIFGHAEGEAGINPYVYDITGSGQQRKSIEEARRLLAEAGYPEGRDIRSGKPLVLYFDTASTGPDAKARLDWLAKQFDKLNLQLVIRGTDYNRFQDKMLKGTAQIFQWGWNADYPDPENFLFLLYGPNSKVGLNGENAANYSNPEFDRLFDEVKNMENSPDRARLIGEMMDIARYDAPWVWGFFPKQFSLHHGWYKNSKPNLMANNGIKYKRILPEQRAALQAQWNRPVLWPLYAIAALLLLVVLPAMLAYRRQQRQPAVRESH